MKSRLIQGTAEAHKYVAGFEAGMTQSLERLGELLATGPEPLVFERTFNVSISRLWKALTDVEEMRHWYFDLQEFKPEIGFEFEFIVEHEGMSYHHLCKITEVVQQRRSRILGDTRAMKAIRRYLELFGLTRQDSTETDT